MGDNFLKQQVRNFNKGRDKALAELSLPSLFPVSVERQVVYTAFELDGGCVSPHERLLAVPSRVQGRVDLIRGTKLVGYSDGEFAEPILGAAAGIGVYVQVESKSELSGVLQIQLISTECK